MTVAKSIIKVASVLILSSVCALAYADEGYEAPHNHAAKHSSMKSKRELVKVDKQLKQKEKDLKKLKASIKTQEAKLAKEKKDKKKYEAQIKKLDKQKVALNKSAKAKKYMTAKHNMRQKERYPASTDN